MSEPPAGQGEDTRALAPVRERARGYDFNGEWVATSPVPDIRPMSWRERFRARYGVAWNDRRVLLVAGGVVLGLTVLVVVLALVARTSGPARMPKQQREVLAAVAQGQAAVRNGNDLTVVTAARDRSAAICRLLGKDGRVQDWVGTIQDLGTVLGGDQGHLTVSIGRSTRLRTWSRQAEDAQDHTLIDSHSDVYRTLSGLHEGDRVRFSGSFRPSSGTCLHETSVFDRNAVKTPSFVFRFTAVAPR